MNNKLKYRCIVIGLFIVIIVITMLNYRQDKMLTDTQANLQKMYHKEQSNKQCQYKKRAYSDIIKDIEKKSCIKIKKVINNNHDKVFTMELEFKGEKEKLNEFMKYMKNQKDLYEIKGIQISSKDSKIYSGNITLNFCMKYL